MAGTYYKYAERQAEEQIDWSVVGKTISDTLADVNKVREEKKAVIDENTRKYMKYVQESPQGQFQDGNKFTNAFAHDMMEQQLIDTKLLKSGQMKLQDYTLRRQNYKDGTETLFSLSKMYQDVYKQRMDNLLSGKSQAINGANMALVEGFADFSKSKAFINPTSGEVNIGMMKMNEKTGQLELDNTSIVPVNVLKGKIQAEIPTFDVEGEMNKSVKGLGNVIRTIYSKASKTTYGTIEKLTGVLSLDATKNPEFKPEIDLFNKAIDQTIDGYFADDYHLTSVLTQNIGGKYSQESFTYNRDEADADPSKILLKINPSTGLGTIDKSAKNFKAQEAEAKDWVKTSIKSKLDTQKEKVTTATVPYGPQPPQKQQWQYVVENEASEREKVAGYWNQLYTGATQAEKKSAADALLGTKTAMANNLMKIDLSVPGKVTLIYKDSNFNVTKDMEDANGIPIPLGDWAGKGNEIHGIDDKKKAMLAGGGGLVLGYGRLDETQYENLAASRGTGTSAQTINITPDLFTIKSVASAKKLQQALPQGFVVTDEGGWARNNVKVTAPDGVTIFEYNANTDEEDIPAKLKELATFIETNKPEGSAEVTTNAATKGGKTLTGGKQR